MSMPDALSTAWALAKSPKCENVYVAPGNGGTAVLEKAYNVGGLDACDGDAVLEFAQGHDVDMVVIGPDFIAGPGEIIVKLPDDIFPDIEENKLERILADETMETAAAGAAETADSIFSRSIVVGIPVIAHGLIFISS